MAASGITDLLDAEGSPRTILGDFLMRAEAAAAIREAEQETVSAVDESVEAALAEFIDRVGDVDAT